MGTADPYLLPGVLWEGSDTAPAPVSYFELNELAENMRKDRRLVIELRVHAGDDYGGAILAQRRADYLKGFLIAAGVEPHRVLAVGSEGVSILGSPYIASESRRARAVVEVIPKGKESLADED